MVDEYGLGTTLPITEHGRQIKNTGTTFSTDAVTTARPDWKGGRGKFCLFLFVSIGITLTATCTEIVDEGNKTFLKCLTMRSTTKIIHCR